MKGILFIVVLAAAAYWLYNRRENAPPQVIENPVYGEFRVSVTAGSRDIEAALFVRATSEADCTGRGFVGWSEALAECPGCKLEQPRCSETLAPRYARLFDNVPIPSAYLAATAGNALERDGRMVIYGLTDAEGVQLCEMLKTNVRKRYKGDLTCIAPSGG